MRIRLCFKTPDVTDAINEQFEKDEDGEMTWQEVRMRNFVDKFVKYGEYITVEFDLEHETVKVLEV